MIIWLQSLRDKHFGPRYLFLHILIERPDSVTVFIW
jgi:hypothetical protein